MLRSYSRSTLSAKASLLPKKSTCTEWSITRSTGTRGLIFKFGYLGTNKTHGANPDVSRRKYPIPDDAPSPFGHRKILPGQSDASDMGFQCRFSVVPAAAYWGVPRHLAAFAGAIAAVVLALRDGMPLELHVATIAMGLMTGLGITVGFHRLFTHRSFKTFRPIEWTLAVLGCMAGQSTLFFWVSEHRRHHRDGQR